MIYNRKTQTEILGLVIIVILFAMGLLFGITLLAKKPAGAEIKHRFYSKELAQNFLLAMLKSNTAGCKGLTMTELLRDCYEGGHKCNNGYNSCDNFRNITIYILNHTLDVQQREYYFRAYVQRGGIIVENLINISTPNCREGMEGVLGNQPIPLDPGTIEVDLYVCT